MPGRFHCESKNDYKCVRLEARILFNRVRQLTGKTIELDSMFLVSHLVYTDKMLTT